MSVSLVLTSLRSLAISIRIDSGSFVDVDDLLPEKLLDGLRFGDKSSMCFIIFFARCSISVILAMVYLSVSKYIYYHNQQNKDFYHFFEIN